MNIREETSADIAGIRLVEHAAFGQPNEANLVDALRVNDKFVISLVAEEGGAVLGHIAFTEIIMEPSSDKYRIAGLAPVAVKPDKQKSGIGSALIKNGLEQAKQLGYTHVVLLGDPVFYSRFGFHPARAHRIRNEYTEGDEFMIIALTESPMPVDLIMKYQTEFACV